MTCEAAEDARDRSEVVGNKVCWVRVRRLSAAHDRAEVMKTDMAAQPSVKGEKRYA